MSVTLDETRVSDHAGTHASPRVTQWHVIRSEWKKLWSLRSTRWCLLLTVLVTILAPVIYSLIQMSQWHTYSQSSRAMFDSIDAAASGHYIAQLVVGFLGVLTVSGEYSTGTIRSSFMAVPRRLPVLWAKFVVFAAVLFGLLLVSNLITFFVVQVIVTVHHVNQSITAPHAIRVVLMDPVIVTLVGLLGIALGALTRSTAAGAAVLVFLIFVITGVVALLPQSIANDVNPYLPINAAYTAATSTFDPGSHLSTWGGFGVFAALVGVVIVLGATRLRRGDA